VVDTDAADIAAITTVFNADFAHQAVTPGDGDDLVWSPTDSQSHLLALINGATASLRLFQEEMSDTAVINAKVIEADFGTSAAKAFIGSENVTASSLNDNRELGLIVSTPAILSSIEATFSTDFSGGTPFTS
jgi:cardiolipin synthase A/B